MAHEESAPIAIEAVVKITERCNIDCTYCHVFNKGDESYKTHDKAMSVDTIDNLGKFLAEGAAKLGARIVNVDFHGGEPLMMKKSRFEDMCSRLRQHIREPLELHFNLQTNGLLIDQEWLQIFGRHKVAAGISLDGPPEVNDIERIDHKGRGTYARARKGLDALMEANKEGLVPNFGVLVVSSAKTSGRDIYRHFIEDVGVNSLDFLLPIDSHDDFDASTARAYGQFLCDAFDEWVSDNDPFIFIRIFHNTIAFLKEGRRLSVTTRQMREHDYHLMTISSSGHIGPDDSLRVLGLGLFDQYKVQDQAYADFLADERQIALQKAQHTLPEACMDCSWKNMCRGGAAHGRLINRYSSEKGFNNPSIICEGLQLFYSHVAAYLLRDGLSFERLKDSLIHNDAELVTYGEDGCPFASDAPLGLGKARAQISRATSAA